MTARVAHLWSWLCWGVQTDRGVMIWGFAVIRAEGLGAQQITHWLLKFSRRGYSSLPLAYVHTLHFCSKWREEKWDICTQTSMATHLLPLPWFSPVCAPYTSSCYSYSPTRGHLPRIMRWQITTKRHSHSFPPPVHLPPTETSLPCHCSHPWPSHLHYESAWSSTCNSGYDACPQIYFLDSNLRAL